MNRNATKSPSVAAVGKCHSPTDAPDTAFCRPTVNCAQR
jgi:hypothetical protein